MAFSFDPTLDTDLDKVRFAIADTVEASALVPDETITALLTSEGSVIGAAIAACRFILRRFARVPDTTVGDVRVSMSALTEQYRAILKELQKQSISGATPYAGGISIADKRGYETDTDRTEPFFGRELPESAWTTREEYGRW